MKTTLLIIINIILLSVLAGCYTDDAKSTAAELDMASKAGAEAAQNAVALPAGSYERDDAILAIRAKETELRMAGFEECADSFAAAAERIILPKL